MAKDFNDLVKLTPLNRAQSDFMQSLADPSVQVAFALGEAGTGKTVIALHEAVHQLKQNKIRQILYTKPIVEMDELSGIGFLPGSESEKLDPMLYPVKDNLQVFCKDGIAKYMLEKEQIKPILLQDLRGRSLNDTFLIADEMQNVGKHALKLLLSRIGRGSKFAILGDPKQVDYSVRGTNALTFAEHNLRDINGVSFDFFERSDIVRNGIIRDILERFESYIPHIGAA